MRGSFIVFEGPDGCGTTSHAKFLNETLQSQGSTTLLTAEPTPGPVGKFIREALKTGGLPSSSLQLLFCADRAAHVERDIIPALERGETVITDRYTLSTIAYGDALGLDAQWLEKVNDAFLKPDILLLLLPPLEVCLSRLAERTQRDILEGDSLQARVHKAYQRWASRHPETAIIDSSGTKEETAELIARHVLTKLATLRAAPVAA